jgi:hypothetical protein
VAAAAAVVVAVVAVIWAGLSLAQPGGAQPGGAQAGPTRAVEVRRTMTPDQDAAGRDAARRALEAQTPGPLAAAVGAVVPPGTSAEAVRDLTLLVNLICNGDTGRAEALTALQDRGLDAATAAGVLGAAAGVQPCPAASP